MAASRATSGLELVSVDEVENNVYNLPTEQKPMQKRPRKARPHNRSKSIPIMRAGKPVSGSSNHGDSDDNGTSPPITLRLGAEDYSRLMALAKKARRKRGSMARIIIEDGLPILERQLGIESPKKT
jgi:hypothetical protein